MEERVESTNNSCSSKERFEGGNLGALTEVHHGTIHRYPAHASFFSCQLLASYLTCPHWQDHCKLAKSMLRVLWSELGRMGSPQPTITNDTMPRTWQIVRGRDWERYRCKLCFCLCRFPVSGQPSRDQNDS